MILELYEKYMDILEAADKLAKSLIGAHYFGKRFSSGYDFTTGERDIQYIKTDKVLTKEIAQKYCPTGYEVTMCQYFTTGKHEYVSVAIKEKSLNQ